MAVRDGGKPRSFSGQQLAGLHWTDIMEAFEHFACAVQVSDAVFCCRPEIAIYRQLVQREVGI